MISGDCLRQVISKSMTAVEASSFSQPTRPLHPRSLILQRISKSEHAGAGQPGRTTCIFMALSLWNVNLTSNPLNATLAVVRAFQMARICDICDMTLNLILTSKDAVYLSGDFRLVSISDQAALPDSYDTQKLIPVIRPGWAAPIAYMGIASAPPLMSDMGQWIVEQMDSIPLDGSFSEIWRRLLKLNLWLGRIRGDRRIALSVVGFSKQEPSMMLISNFLDLHGRVSEAGPHLRAYLRK